MFNHNNWSLHTMNIVNIASESFSDGGEASYEFQNDPDAMAEFMDIHIPIHDANERACDCAIKQEDILARVQANAVDEPEEYFCDVCGHDYWIEEPCLFH